MLSHLRAFLFIDFPNLEHPSIAIRVFYFVSGLGHQAVVIFFVLSGYFVGGSVVYAWRKGDFQWARYAIARLSRLWTVLIPALIWTFLLDVWGQQMNPAAYLGTLREHYHSGPSLLVPASHGLNTILSNLSFLQGITAPTFGTNGPLWSLTNEFWYYFLFPTGLLAVGVLVPGMRHRSNGRTVLTHLAIFAILVTLLPVHVVKAGITWLLGVVVWWWNSRPEHSGTRSSQPVQRDNLPQVLVRVATLGALAATLFGARIGKSWGSDLAVGVMFAACLVAWNRFEPASKRVKELLFWSSEISYSLYLYHFPFLFLICAGFLGGQKWHPGPTGFALLLLLAVATIGISVGGWWLFERRTPAVRAFLVRRIAGSS